MKIIEHIELLGFKVEDRVTGWTGIVTSISFDLYGCIQAVVTPPVNNEGKKENGIWCDIGRLKVLDKKRVMDIPDFTGVGSVAEGNKGGFDKPLP